MKQDLTNEIKRLEAETAKLEKQKAELLRKQEEEEQRLKQLDQIVENSGFESAKQLIEALMARYRISPSQLSRKGTAGGGSGRTRTKVTADLRDRIRADLATGMSKTAVGAKHGVSYLVVRGVETGKYDHLS